VIESRTLAFGRRRYSRLSLAISGLLVLAADHKNLFILIHSELQALLWSWCFRTFLRSANAENDAGESAAAAASCSSMLLVAVWHQRGTPLRSPQSMWKGDSSVQKVRRCRETGGRSSRRCLRQACRSLQGMQFNLQVGLHCRPTCN